MKKIFVLLFILLSSCKEVVDNNYIELPKIITPTEMYPTFTPTIKDVFANMQIDLSPLKGAIININNSPYLINVDGNLNRLGGTVGYGFDITINGDEYVYSIWDNKNQSDIYYCNRGITTDCYNITKTSDQSEFFPVLWESEDKIIFISGEEPHFDVGNDIPYVVNAMDKNGNNKTKLWEIKSIFNHNYSFSKKEPIIAISYEPGLLYINGEYINIIPEDYGLPNGNLSSPAWSPKENKIAWVLTEQNEKEEEFTKSVVIINLDTKESEIIEQYRVGLCACDIPDEYITWSPDGRWIAIIAYGEKYQENNGVSNLLFPVTKKGPLPSLKIIDILNNEIFIVKNAIQPLVWSINGDWLTYIDCTNNPTNWPSIIELETHRTSRILNERFEVIDWIYEN